MLAKIDFMGTLKETQLSHRVIEGTNQGMQPKVAYDASLGGGIHSDPIFSVRRHRSVERLETA